MVYGEDKLIIAAEGISSSRKEGVVSSSRIAETAEEEYGRKAEVVRGKSTGEETSSQKRRERERERQDAYLARIGERDAQRFDRRNGTHCNKVLSGTSRGFRNRRAPTANDVLK